MSRSRRYRRCLACTGVACPVICSVQLQEGLLIFPSRFQTVRLAGNAQVGPSIPNNRPFWAFPSLWQVKVPTVVRIRQVINILVLHPFSALTCSSRVKRAHSHRDEAAPHEILLTRVWLLNRCAASPACANIGAGIILLVVKRE